MDIITQLILFFSIFFSICIFCSILRINLNSCNKIKEDEFIDL
jgi:hypothetical protein